MFRRRPAPLGKCVSHSAHLHESFFVPRGEAIFYGTLLLAFMLALWSILLVEFVHPLNSTLSFDGCERCARGFASSSAWRIRAASGSGRSSWVKTCATGRQLVAGRLRRARGLLTSPAGCRAPCPRSLPMPGDSARPWNRTRPRV